MKDLATGENHGPDYIRTFGLSVTRRPAVGAQRACPDCGRPQHYTGTEYGWAHDAVIDLMRCAASPELLAEMEKCRARDAAVTPALLAELEK